jgi:hypothetical protein
MSILETTLDIIAEYIKCIERTEHQELKNIYMSNISGAVELALAILWNTHQINAHRWLDNWWRYKEQEISNLVWGD